MLDIPHLAFLIFFGTHISGLFQRTSDLGSKEEEQVLIEMAEQDYISNYEEDYNKKSSENKQSEEFLDVSGFEEGCGTRAKAADQQNRIIGGTATPPHSFPWIVRLHG